MGRSRAAATRRNVVAVCRVASSNDTCSVVRSRRSCANHASCSAARRPSVRTRGETARTPRRARTRDVRAARRPILGALRPPQRALGAGRVALEHDAGNVVRCHEASQHELPDWVRAKKRRRRCTHTCVRRTRAHVHQPRARVGAPPLRQLGAQVVGERPLLVAARARAVQQRLPERDGARQHLCQRLAKESGPRAPLAQHEQQLGSQRRPASLLLGNEPIDARRPTINGRAVPLP